MKNINKILHYVKNDKIINKINSFSELIPYCNNFLYTQDWNIYNFFGSHDNLYLYIGRSTKDAYFIKFKYNWCFQKYFFESLHILEDFEFNGQLNKFWCHKFVVVLNFHTRYRTNKYLTLALSKQNTKFKKEIL